MDEGRRGYQHLTAPLCSCSYRGRRSGNTSLPPNPDKFTLLVAAEAWYKRISKCWQHAHARVVCDAQVRSAYEICLCPPPPPSPSVIPFVRSLLYFLLLLFFLLLSLLFLLLLLLLLLRFVLVLVLLMLLFSLSSCYCSCSYSSASSSSPQLVAWLLNLSEPLGLDLS